MDFSNIPTGLKITSQIPLNVKEFCKDEDTLAYLGVDDNLAFTYHDQLEVLCLAEKSIYIWREVQVGEENTGLIPLDFTYPTGLSNVYDINYSGKKYNFFLKEYVTTETLQDLIKIENVGTGFKVYKGFNSTTNKHEIKTVIIDSQSSNGASFVRDLQENTDDITVRIKKLVSDNLTITATDEEVRIETPMTASIPALYVNNLYEPTYQEWLSENSSQNGGTPIVGFQYIGKGTLAQPFTDSIVYPLAGGSATITPNTAIQNALDGDAVYSYVGNLTRLNPQRKGQKITIQDNTTFYIFPGDFEYTALNLKIEGYVGCTAAGYLIDMDNSLNITTPSTINIEVSKDKVLEIFGKGFKNNGTTTATNNFINYNQIILSGEGTISFKGNDINKHVINSDKDSTGNTTKGFNNDGAWQFEVRCYLESEFQGLVALGGVSRIYSLGGTFKTGTVFTNVDINLKAFNLKGGTLRLIRNSTIVYYGSNITSRLKLFTLEPTNGFTPTLEKSNCLMAGNCTTLYSKENNNTFGYIFS